MLGSQWISSSKCVNKVGECVQVRQVATNWHKSSASGASGDCVEVADSADFVLVRDSKNPGGPVLTFTGPEWDAFLAGVKAEEFDRGPF